MAYLHITTLYGNPIYETYWRGAVAADAVELKYETGTPVPLSEPYGHLPEEMAIEERHWLTRQRLLPSEGPVLAIKTDRPGAIAVYSRDEAFVVAYSYETETAEPRPVQDPSEMPEMWSEQRYRRDRERRTQMVRALYPEVLERSE